MDRNDQVTYFARTNFRGYHQLFGIRRADRRHHFYLVGKTGTGKSTLLSTLAAQDIRNGEGLALLDPHGDLVDSLLTQVPEHRQRDLIYFNVADTEHPLAFNPLARVPANKRPVAAAGLLEVFHKIWNDSWGPRLEHILRNTLLTLFDQPEATLADIPRLFEDASYRRNAALRVAHAQIRRFWLEEYERYPVRFRTEAIAPIQNKVGAFLADPTLYRILSQPKSSFDLRDVMDNRRILLVNLAKGKVGESATALLGAMLVSHIGLAGMGRAGTPQKDRQDFYLYLDEFQNFTTLGLASMLSELRKYRVNLILANQFLIQVDSPVTQAILGNVGTLISFRLGPMDAKLLEPEFMPKFDAVDLMNLPNHRVYLKLMIDGTVSPPFSAETIELAAVR